MSCKRFTNLTEWDNFIHADYDKIKVLLKALIVFDGKNLFSKKWAAKVGIEYIGIAVYN